jgi:hypothetical protein
LARLGADLTLEVDGRSHTAVEFRGALLIRGRMRPA